jgi:hypothetical protein
MPRRARKRLPSSSIILAGGLLFLSAAPGGCGSEKLALSNVPYDGPPIRVDSAGPQHIVIVSTPSGGWAVQLDQTRQEFERTDVFITARRPNPALLQTQAALDHFVATTVPSQRAASIYLRVLDYKRDSGDASYHLAALATPPATPIAPTTPAAPAAAH